MLRSMTGFGRATLSVEGATLIAEVKSVNSRFLDLSFKLPSRWDSLEMSLAKLIRPRLSRGKVSVSVYWLERSGPNTNLEVDRSLIREYATTVRLMAPGCALKVSPVSFIGAPGVVAPANAGLNTLSESVSEVATRATNEFIHSREVEGAAIERELSGFVAELDQIVSRIELITPQVHSKLQDRMEDSLGKLGEHAKLLLADRERISKEVAALLVKADFQEELSRLQSHIDTFSEKLNSDGPNGRFFEFTLQEILRELNTLSSKSPLLEVIELTIDAKAIVERLKEQVANVE